MWARMFLGFDWQCTDFAHKEGDARTIVNELATRKLYIFVSGS